MSNITKKQILAAAKGSTRRKCAEKLGIPFDSLRYLIDKYKIRGVFNTGNRKCPHDKEYYLSVAGKKTPEQIAVDNGVCVAHILKMIRKLGLNESFGMANYNPEDQWKAEPLTKKIDVKCYNGCEEVFSKTVSMDVINKVVRMPRFLCPACKATGVETVYTYPGQ